MSSFALLFFILGVFCPGIFFPCVLLWIHLQILFERDKCDKKKILGLNLKVLFWYNCFSKKIVIGFGPPKKIADRPMRYEEPYF